MHGEETQVTTISSRECREWPAGAAQALCSNLFWELGGDAATIIATDGSFNPDTNRAGWGYLIQSEGNAVSKGSGCHTIYTSSTRMEFEAIQQALLCLAALDKPMETAIFATDSMAVLCRIRAGNLPYNWHMFRQQHPVCRVFWVHVPGHAGVTINEEADRLAGLSDSPTPLELYPPDLKLMAAYSAKEDTCQKLKQYWEGERLVELGADFGQSAASHLKGPAKRLNNQHLTGNTTSLSIHLLLDRRDDGEKISF